MITDSANTEFDPYIHDINIDGKPRLTRTGKFYLLREGKLNAPYLVDRFYNLHDLEKPEKLDVEEPISEDVLSKRVTTLLEHKFQNYHQNGDFLEITSKNGILTMLNLQTSEKHIFTALNSITP